MKVLCQFGIIFGVFWVSQCIEAVLPFPFPSSVIGLLMLLGLLMLRVIRVESIREAADFLLGNLTFCLIPVVTSSMNYVDIIRENALPFFVVCVVSTIVTYAAVVWAVHLTCRLMKKGGDEA